MTLRDDLLEALKGWNVLAADSASDDEPLLSSGRLDSSALFQLSLWVEERIGHPLDPSSFNIAREWETVAGILEFIERVRARKTADMVPQTHAPATATRRLRNSESREFEIVRYSDSDRDAVVELQRRLWSTDEDLNRRFFEWRYEHNPVRADPLIYLAVSHGRPVAMRGAFASLWQAGRDSRPAIWYQSDDLVVLPDYENKGTFAAFSDHLRRDLAARGQRFFLSLSALRVTRMQSVAGGARSIGPMKPVAYRPGATVAVDHLRRLAKRMPFAWRLADVTLPGESAARSFECLDRASSVSRSSRSLSVSRNPRPAEMASLIARLDYDGRVRQVRDEHFLGWRFRNPLHEYRFIYAGTPGQMTGFMVLERSVSDLANHRRIHIADWEAESNHVFADLLETAVRGCRPAELVSWTETLGMARSDCLERRGFVPTDTEQTARGLPSVLVWSTNDGDQDVDFRVADRSLLRLADWDLRMSFTSLA